MKDIVQAANRTALTIGGRTSIRLNLSSSSRAHEDNQAMLIELRETKNKREQLMHCVSKIILSDKPFHLDPIHFPIIQLEKSDQINDEPVTRPVTRCSKSFGLLNDSFRKFNYLVDMHPSDRTFITITTFASRCYRITVRSRHDFIKCGDLLRVGRDFIKVGDDLLRVCRYLLEVGGYLTRLDMDLLIIGGDLLIVVTDLLEVGGYLTD